jgi:hypothetical protein
MTGMSEQTDKKRIDLKTTQVAAGSMASVTSAVAASQLGVAGTLIGAGVGSVVGTVAGAVYEHYLERTHHRVRSVVPYRTGGAEVATDELSGIRDGGKTSTGLAEQSDASDEGEAANPIRRVFGSRRLALGATAAAGLGIALVALTGFEAVTGQPVSAGSESGTSIGQVLGRSSSDADADPDPTPTTDQPTDEPTSSPTQPGTAPTTTGPAPTAQPSTTPSVSPTSEPTATPPNAG